MYGFSPFNSHALLYAKTLLKKAQFCSILRAQTQCQAVVQLGLWEQPFTGMNHGIFYSAIDWTGHMLSCNLSKSLDR